MRAAPIGKVVKRGIKCPLGHKFTILLGPEHASEEYIENRPLNYEGWTPSAVGKIVRLRVVQSSRTDFYDFGHEFFLVCPSCGTVFRPKGAKLRSVESVVGISHAKNVSGEQSNQSGQRPGLSGNKYAKMLEALSKGPKSGDELTVECGFETRMKCAGVLAVLRKTEAVAEIGRGRYQITELGRTALKTGVMPKFNV